MLRVPPTAFLAVSTVFLLSSSIEAQLPGPGGGMTVGARAGYVALGVDFSDADGAVGLEGILRYDMPGGFGIGVGIHRSSHGWPDSDHDAELVGVFAEPRYRLPVGSPSVTPFIAGRLGWLHQSFPSPVGDVEVSGNGYEAGGMGGASFEVAPKVAIEAAIAVTYTSVSDAEGEERSNGNFERVELKGSTVGTAVGLLLGVSISL